MEMTEILKEGDHVILKSQNRATIGSYALCHWFYNGELREGKFSLSELQKINK